MGQNFPCSDCDNHFTQKANLLTHQKSVHMGQKFKCPDCDNQFTQKIGLDRHKKAVHK